MNSQISCSARGIQWISALRLFAPWQLFFLADWAVRKSKLTEGSLARAGIPQVRPRGLDGAVSPQHVVD